MGLEHANGEIPEYLMEAGFHPVFGSPRAQEGAQGVWVWRTGPTAAATVSLSCGEAERVEKLVDPEKRVRLANSLSTRKHLIAILLGQSVEEVFLSHDTLGKPFVFDVPQVSISFSDAAEWNALAFDRSSPVGVDLEIVRDIGWAAMLPMISDTRECDLIGRSIRALNNLTPFFRCWTAKEAVLKAAGFGMRGDARRIGIPADFICGRTRTAHVQMDKDQYLIDCALLDNTVVTRARRS